MPVRRALLPRGGMVALNRELRYCDLMSMQLLDTRQYRSDQPCGDGFKPACPGVFDKNAQVLGKAQEEWLAKTLGEGRSEEHTSELQSLMRISYAVFCLKK